MVRAFNWAASVTNYSRPEYPIEWVDRGAGIDLIENGDFSSATGWYGYGGSVSISGGKLNFSSTPNNISAYKGTIFTNTKRYRVKYTVSGFAAGSMRIRIGGNPYGTTRTADGTYTEDITSSEATSFGGLWCIGTTTMSIDDFTVVGLGCVLDLNALGLSSATSGYWYDKTNTLTATNSGTTLVVPPASNLRATYFNGTTSKVVFTSGLNLPSGTKTVSVRCLLNNYSTGYRTLFSWGTAGSNTAFYCYIQSNGSIRVGNDTEDGYISTDLLTNNQWYNITITYQAGIVFVYVDGVLSNYATNALTANPNNSILYIGSYIGGSSLFHSGTIGNVNIWSRILSQDEITLVKDTNF
jgi:hypothetical protein